MSAPAALFLLLLVAGAVYACLHDRRRAAREHAAWLRMDARIQRTLLKGRP